jgi:DNA invertase Pin-like site-specific DNA recombinase
MRAAIYARISTENQNERSPGDQMTHCRTFAAEQSWKASAELEAAARQPACARPGVDGLRAAASVGVTRAIDEEMRTYSTLELFA